MSPELEVEPPAPPKPTARSFRSLVWRSAPWVIPGLVAVTVELSTSHLHQRVPETRSPSVGSAGLAFLKAGDPDAAIETYGKALAERRDPFWLEGRALAYEQTGQLDLAMRDLVEADALGSNARIRSKLCDVGTRIGTDIEKLGENLEKLEAAATYCSRVIAEDPKDETALAFRASVRMAQQRLDDAMTDATSALNLDENDDRPRRTRAIGLLQQGKFREAEQDCSKLMAPAKPRLVDFHVCVMAAQGVGDEASFRARLERGLGLYPEDAQLVEKREKFGRAPERR